MSGGRIHGGGYEHARERSYSHAPRSGADATASEDAAPQIAAKIDSVREALDLVTGKVAILETTASRSEYDDAKHVAGSAVASAGRHLESADLLVTRAPTERDKVETARADLNREDQRFKAIVAERDATIARAMAKNTQQSGSLRIRLLYSDRMPDREQEVDSEEGDEGEPLPGSLRGSLESTAGQSLDDVRLRDDPEANELASTHGARALALGSTIHFGAGELDASTPEGQHLIAHETAHAVQAQGATTTPALKPTATTTRGGPAEREADSFADAALAGQSFDVTERLTGDVAALDDGDDAGGGSTNAYMTVRAYDDAGGMLDLWTGPAYFHGDLPSEFVAKKSKKRWHWTRDGAADAEGKRLKIDSDAEGSRGTPVVDWAPDTASMISVDFRNLRSPFGLSNIVVDPDGPLTMIGNLVLETADGAEPAALDAPGTVHGPAAVGTIESSGDLIIEDTVGGTTFTVGDSVMRVVRGSTGGQYAYTVRAQTSPGQRVVDVVATEGVWVDEPYNDPSSPQLVYHLEKVSAAQMPDVDRGDLFGDGALPEIQALSDGVRCTISLDEDRIFVEAVQPGAKFAYWVDPEWSGVHGEERTVHIVATTGVRVDEVSAGNGRRLVANPIYVQNPDLVPEQGTPIDPAAFLGAESFQYGARNRDAVTAFTGTSGVTLVDHDLGVSVTIAIANPTKGARFAWSLDKPEGAFRAIVGPGVFIHVVEGEEQVRIPGDPPRAPYGDFGVTIDLRESTDPDRIPPQGEPLTPEVMSEFPARKPDSHEFKDPLGAMEYGAQMGADMMLAFVPGSDVIDLAEATSGTDKWGNDLSDSERVVAGLAAVLPFVPAAIGKVGRLAGKAGRRAVGELGQLAAKLGKSEEEIEVLFANLRHLDDEGKAAARRVEDAIRLGDEVNPADLAKVDSSLRAIGMNGLPDLKVGTRGGLDLMEGTGPLVRGPDGVPIDELDDVAGDATRTGQSTAQPPASPSAEITTKEKELHAAIGKHHKTLTGGKKAPGFDVKVLSKKQFSKRFGSESGVAVFVIEHDRPVIYARFDARAGDVADEAAHLAQLSDPNVAADLRFLDESNLKDWDDFSVGDKLEFYERKLNVEIDAKKRALATIEDADQLALAQGNLDDLESLQAQVASITDDQLMAMNAKAIPEPAFLDQPARAFAKTKQKVGGGAAPARPADLVTDVDPNVKTREVSRARGEDYSSAYGSEKDVAKVEQIGDGWQEHVVVTSGYDGEIIKVTKEAGRPTTVKIQAGKKTQTYTIEAGAEIPDEIADGNKVKHGQTLGREVPRDYRWVRITKSDGTSTSLAEIRSGKKGAEGFIPRGSENTRRGAEAEASAMTAADADLAKRADKGEISGFKHIDHNVGGGGFDDVIVEFVGESEVKIRIREVKNQPNRHVPLSEFTAISGQHNLENNLAELRRTLENARDALRDGLDPPDAVLGMNEAQVGAALKKVTSGDFHVEIVLGPDTLLGAPGHHASNTLKALQDQFSNPIKVEKL